ncbi:MAG: GMC family oxidoreductase N-terminal domain-containing protein [Meiothermus sp.]|nr:GMC family oxidoreductase N-terminal domain-containing protein [Meiothermus sp.]
MSTEYDYIIIGAGSAGCVLANRLSAKPAVRVLLLEAGGPPKDLNHRVPAAFPRLYKTKADWAFFTEPQGELDGRRLYWPRGKTLGGSSAINAMIYMRGNRFDYDDWKVRGWSFRELLPYFKRLEHHFLGKSDYHATGGPLNVERRRYTNPLTHVFVEACKQAGLTENSDFNGAEQEGAGLFDVTCKNGARHSAADAYLTPALSRPNLTVHAEARAHKVLFDRNLAVGVQYRHRGEVKTAHAGRVVLSSGAVQSPQLLLLSGVGPADHLRRHGIPVQQALPVGHNLWDHLALPVIYRCKQPISLDRAENLLNLAHYLLSRSGPFTSNVAEGGAFVRLMPDAPAPDLQYHFGPAFFHDHGFDRPRRGHFFTVGPVGVAPRSRGFVGLHSPDPEAAPLIQPNYLGDRGDLEFFVRAFEHACLLAGQAAFEAYRGEPALHDGLQSRAEIEGYVRANLQTLYHPAGTCSLGKVVDEGLKVYGTENLYVADASVMPGVVRGNTNVPTIMVAEKAAELLVG